MNKLDVAALTMEEAGELTELFADWPIPPDTKNKLLAAAADAIEEKLPLFKRNLEDPTTYPPNVYRPVPYPPMAVVPTHVIGPIIASYLIDRPSSLKLCGLPCPGPVRWRRKSYLFRDERWFCRCDGNGFCAYSADIGHLRTMRCTCRARPGCLNKPRESWEHTAWQVVRVLKLRSRDTSTAHACNMHDDLLAKKACFRRGKLEEYEDQEKASGITPSAGTVARWKKRTFVAMTPQDEKRGTEEREQKKKFC